MRAAISLSRKLNTIPPKFPKQVNW